MRKNSISILAAVLVSASLSLTACGGNNGDMPPETTTGDTQETGVEGSGDLPGTGAADSAEVDETGAETGAHGATTGQ
ncbi:hypothetical protein [Pontibacter arcticus]|uniref:Uncharacterized protein n=1 Tax=Pontibacter arcticus TaxID=2080288 RepID=A0A364RHD7_9BACT|nr:hypothetical protein [Pontibacter arcticus]RAU83675.1 hypothetical protein DP923_00960 [Pontibacter arcticus]